jgi:hypothetical protein
MRRQGFSIGYVLKNACHGLPVDNITDVRVLDPYFYR